MENQQDFRRGARRSATLILAILFSLFAGLVLLTANASATVFQGGATDHNGDAPGPAMDLQTVYVAYDNSVGSLVVTIELAAPLENTPVQFAAGVGTRDPNGNCGAPLGIVGSVQPDGSVLWLREDTGASPAEATGAASIAIDGSKVVLNAEAAELRGLEPDCGVVMLSDPNDVNTTYDTTDTFAVKPPPPKARLSVAITGLGKQVKRGARYKVKVKVRNSGTAPAGKVKVKLRVSGKASAAPRARKLGQVGVGRTAVGIFKLRVKPKAKGRIKLKAGVTGSAGLKAGANRQARVKVPQGSTAKPPPGSGKLVGQLFWGFEAYQYDRSPDILGLYFANSKFVHLGIPKGGLSNCNRVTAKKDEEGNLGDGCVRYTYNPGSGKLSIGKQRGTYRNGKLKLKSDEDMWDIAGETWFDSAFAKPGARFKLTLQHRGYFGLCGVSPGGCTTWLETLTLDRSGKFGRTRSSISTSGGGALPFIGIASYPPEDRGSYKVMSHGRIRFSYDNGEVSTETLAILTNDRGRPDAANEGVLLDDIWFWKEEDD